MGLPHFQLLEAAAAAVVDAVTSRLAAAAAVGFPDIVLCLF